MAGGRRGQLAFGLVGSSWIWTVTLSADRPVRAAVKWLVIMASTARLLGSTSMLTPVTPRDRARPSSARISAAPTPRRCQASATTTPMSVTRPASALA